MKLPKEIRLGISWQLGFSHIWVNHLWCPQYYQHWLVDIVALLGFDGIYDDHHDDFDGLDQPILSIPSYELHAFTCMINSQKWTALFNFALPPLKHHSGMIQPLGLSQVSTHGQPFAVLHCQVHREVEGALLSWIKKEIKRTLVLGLVAAMHKNGWSTTPLPTLAWCIHPKYPKYSISINSTIITKAKAKGC